MSESLKQRWSAVLSKRTNREDINTASDINDAEFDPVQEEAELAKFIQQKTTDDRIVRLQKAIRPFLETVETLNETASTFARADPHGIIELVTASTNLIVKVGTPMIV